MNIHFGNQSQFELFPGTTGDPIENSAPRFIFSRIILTFENVVVIFVFVIVSLIIAFSLGVERGRVKARLARPAAIQSMSPVVMPSVMPNAQIRVSSMAKSSELAFSGTAIAASMPPPTPNAPRGGSITIPRGGSSPAPRSIPVMTVKPVLAVLEKGVDKGYTIQVASYKSDSMAQKELGELKRKGYESFVMVKGSYVIVCVGRFSEQDEAKKMVNKLKKQYKDLIVRSL